MKLSLSRKPDAVAWSIEDVLERVREGQIRLPEFQRLFKWEADDVLQLFDSIVRGFPIGTLLFWKGATPSSVEGRPLESRPPLTSGRATELLWVLDGQQRLTSLAGVLLASGEPDDARFRIAFALDRDELIKIGVGELWPEMALPLAYILDSVNLMTWRGAKRPALDDRAQRRALEVGKAIREYRVPASIVVAEAEETARLIFDRTNATGKQLTKADVFKALHEGLGAQQPSSLEGLEKSVEDLGFGPLGDTLFLQAAAAVAGLDVTKMDHEALSKPELGSALPSTAAALRRALVFLRNDAHIPHSALLPYGFPVVALARFFHLFPAANPRSRELLSRWVWRGAISQKHWTYEQTYLRETLRAIKGADEEGEIQVLLGLLPKGPPAFEPAEYNLKSAHTRLHLLALLDLRPRDLATGAPLDGIGLIAKEGSAAIPLLSAEMTGDAKEDAARASVFGRVIQRPLGQERLLDLLGGPYADDPVLASLGLEREDVRAARAREPVPFAARRAQRLAKHVGAFFELRARWAASDRPSLSSMLVEDSP